MCELQRIEFEEDLNENRIVLSFTRLKRLHLVTYKLKNLPYYMVIQNIVLNATRTDAGSVGMRWEAVWLWYCCILRTGSTHESYTTLLNGDKCRISLVPQKMVICLLVFS